MKKALGSAIPACMSASVRKLLNLLLATVVAVAFDVAPFRPITRVEAVIPVHLPNYTTFGGQITRDGLPITLHGVNWFGFDTPAHVVGGLWVRSLPSLISQLQQEKVTAVRLPICPSSLSDAPVSSINYYINPQLQGLTARQTLQTVSQSLDAANISILLDFHSNDCSTISPLWYSANHSQSQWIAELVDATHLLAPLPHFIGIDLQNEPFGATWGTGNLMTDWNTAAEQAGKAVLLADPRILIIVQGIWENPSCASSYNHFWGGNLEPIRCTPLSLPANKTVLSPHIFGSDISSPSYYKSANFPANLPLVWQTQFGSLAPSHSLLIGEWGGKMGTDGGSAKDLKIQQAFTDYLISQKICNGFYWSFGPNSRDTGGLLESDWQTIWPVKQEVLQHYFSACS